MSFQLPFGLDVTNALPADTKYGPYVDVAAACAAIPLALRYDGLTVQITGSGNYWWLDADLTDPGLVSKQGFGNAVTLTGDQTIEDIKSFIGTESGIDYLFQVHNGSPDLYTFGDNTLAPYFACFRAENTRLSPTGVLDGANLGGVTCFGYDNVNYGNSSARMTAFATESFSSGSHGTELVFETTPNGSNTKQVAMILTQDQNIMCATAGATFQIKYGANAYCGTVQLTAGVGTITSSVIDGTCAVWLSRTVVSGAGVYPQITLGSGSADISGSATDNGLYNWMAMKFA